MDCYAVQVCTATEDAFIARASALVPGGRFVFPKRRLSVRRKGKVTQELYPLFPGYVFLEVEELAADVRQLVSAQKHFCRFLPSNQDARPLSPRDLVILRQFLGGDGVAEASSVFFDADDRIVVVSGPMLGLEGRIVKVDRRKQRAKVRLDFASEVFLLDLAFQVIERKAAAGGDDDRA